MLGYLFNEHSELCLWRSCLAIPPSKDSAKQEGFSGLTPEEGMILKRLQDKQMSARQKEKREEKARENGVALGGQGEDGEEGEGEEKQPQITASGLYNDAIQRIRMAFYTP
jgi:TATA-binding protein-associated factor Taf7